MSKPNRTKYNVSLYHQYAPDEVYSSIIGSPDGIPAARRTGCGFLDAFVHLIHTRGNIGILGAAKALGLPPTVVAATVRALTGWRPADWIHRYVYLCARELLVGTEWPQQWIAERLGFATAGGFSKFYKQHQHYNPGACRDKGNYHFPLVNGHRQRRRPSLTPATPRGTA
ncbi:MAG: helix-turn-helix domain-containing protein [Verrucomicrobiales bacterium]|jgi:AraC-like DNA-binding protein|nr:helix-turn-helix domain-containing protein [Verrucomicrobiales bacterium]